MNWTTKQKQLVLDYKQTFNSEHGQRVLADIAKQCWVNQDIFDTDPMTLAYREGQRAMAIRIIRSLKLNPSQVDDLIQYEEEQDDGLY